MMRTVFCNSLAAVALVFFASTAMAGDAPVQPSESVTKIIVTDPATGTSATAAKKPPQAYAGDDPDSASKAKTPHGKEVLPPLNMVIGGQRLESKAPSMGLAPRKGPAAPSAPYVQPKALLGVFVQP